MIKKASLSLFLTLMLMGQSCGPSPVGQIYNQPSQRAIPDWQLDPKILELEQDLGIREMPPEALEQIKGVDTDQ